MLKLLVNYGRRSSVVRTFAASAAPMAQAAVMSIAHRGWQRNSTPRQFLQSRPVSHALPLATVSNGMAASSRVGTGADAVAVYVTVPDLQLGTFSVMANLISI